MPLRRPPRIAVGGLSHETNTFSPVRTGLAAFRQRAYLVGEALLRQSRFGRSALGGIVDAITAAGGNPLPVLFASAPPGGTLTADARSALQGEFLDRLRAHRLHPLGIDGVVLSLHGAMVAEGCDDGEGELLRAVRSEVGPGVPVIATLDSHATLTPAMVEAADLLVGYETYPHIDPYERGLEAVAGLLQLRTGRTRAVPALRRLPMLIPLPAQRTDGGGPMAEVVVLARALKAEPGIIGVTVCGGFPFADVPEAGASVLVTAAGDPDRARRGATMLAEAVWARRERLRPAGVGVDAALDAALEVRGGPVVLADVADNPGAGAPGDGTWILGRALERNLTGVVIGALPDPATVSEAWDAGEGETVRIGVGGKVDPRGGPPVEATWRVERLTEGTFINGGPIGYGGPTRLGRTATLSCAGVEVIACERPVQALDPELFRSCGVDPAARHIVAVKSSVHFRAALAPLARAIIEVEAGGLSGSDLTAFPFARVRRPVWPLDRLYRLD